MKIILYDTSNSVIKAWQQYFSNCQDVEIYTTRDLQYYQDLDWDKKE